MSRTNRSPAADVHRHGLREVLSALPAASVFAFGPLHAATLWTPELLAWAAVLVGWSAEPTLTDRFEAALETLADLFPRRVAEPAGGRGAFGAVGRGAQGRLRSAREEGDRQMAPQEDAEAGGPADGAAGTESRAA